MARGVFTPLTVEEDREREWDPASPVLELRLRGVSCLAWLVDEVVRVGVARVRT